VFIDYNKNQLTFPLDVEVHIPEHHLSRVVHTAVEAMDLSILLSRYPGGGRPPYHPKMMLKILLYAYAKGIYSSRKIEEQLHENIHFMWLSDEKTPDFRTINRFRSERMKDVIYETFFSLIDLLKQEGLVKLEDYFLDGTKIEANANRYTFVWKKSTEKYDQKLDEKYQKIVATIEQASEDDQKAELEEEQMKDTCSVTSEKIKQTIQTLEKRLQDEPKNKTMKKAKRQLENDLLPRKIKYEAHKETFQERNSFSKTDTDATFMRMKEDHMKNGQLKPGYNIQIGTEDQFITGFSIHQKAGDTTCLIPHFEIFEKYNRVKPQNVVADSGYGSEENYAFCEEKKMKAYVKYNTFEKEQKKAWTKQIGRVENMFYEEELDEWICANKKRLIFSHESKQQTSNGYTSIKRTYRCTECLGCPFQETCAKGKETKSISVSVKNQKQRKEVRERLHTKEGKELYGKRKIEVEPVFGHIKYNRFFQRFSLRGLSKNRLEWGLICVAHNLRKWTTTAQSKAKKPQS
jgi:transposase